MFEEGKATYKVDVLAFGVTIWELLTGKEPFSGLTEMLILAAVRDGKHSQHLMISSEVEEKNVAALIEMCVVAGKSYPIVL